ncbi:hypothetical protein GGR52DRAFT_521646 [Hypoxylon sp. FL1284]|nr:hypothetical protein GGR52DRAFT_521646 [Hypoxylon sp. FL1284]
MTFRPNSSQVHILSAAAAISSHSYKMPGLVTPSSPKPPIGPDPQPQARAYKPSISREACRELALYQTRVVKSLGVSKPRAASGRAARRRKSPQLRWGRVADQEESRRLAADPHFVLPSDRARCKPRLQRQEAFHQPRDYHHQLYHSDAVADDAELYRLGLLYDDEHPDDEPFNLNAISHADPVYAVRPPKRARKQRRREEPSYMYLDVPLSPLDSGAEGQRLTAPDVHEIPAPVDDSRQMALEDGTARKRSYRDAALSVIQELPETSRHALEPSAPEAAEILDLVTDNEEEEEEEEEEEAEDGPGDWALLDDTEVLSATGDVDIDARADAEEDAAGEETWVVLGDGS